MLQLATTALPELKQLRVLQLHGTTCHTHLPCQPTSSSANPSHHAGNAADAAAIAKVDAALSQLTKLRVLTLSGAT